MKSLAEQMQNFDRENFRRVAAGLPEFQDDKPQIEQVAKIINAVFSQLLAAFPAALASRDQAEMNEIRRQWVLAFRENGITSMEQVAAGMRAARRQEKPFLPSPGQFVAWCKEESAIASGLPTAAELVDLVYQYARARGYYDDAECYPWECNEHYWMVTTLYSQMRANALTDSELRKKAAEELVTMSRRLVKGEIIPEPTKRLPVLGGKPLTQQQGLAKVAEIRERFGFKGGRK